MCIIMWRLLPWLSLRSRRFHGSSLNVPTCQVKQPGVIALHPVEEPEYDYGLSILDDRQVTTKRCTCDCACTSRETLCVHANTPSNLQ